MDNYPVDSNALRNRGTKGVMSAIGRRRSSRRQRSCSASPYVGWIVGGGLVLLGISGLFGKSKTDRTSGGIMLGRGLPASPPYSCPGSPHFLLGAGGLALLAFGAWNIFKFVKGFATALDDAA